MSAVLGGTKTGNSAYSFRGLTYNFGNQLFNGTPVVVKSMFKFDLMSPTHCLLLQAGSITPGTTRINCTFFPIYLDQDIRTVCYTSNWTESTRNTNRQTLNKHTSRRTRKYTRDNNIQNFIDSSCE